MSVYYKKNHLLWKYLRKILNRKFMKKAIKVLEKRIELLNKELEKIDKKFDECEMLYEYEYLRSDLTNMEIEIIELKKAIYILNKKI